MQRGKKRVGNTYFIPKDEFYKKWWLGELLSQLWARPFLRITFSSLVLSSKELPQQPGRTPPSHLPHQSTFILQTVSAPKAVEVKFTFSSVTPGVFGDEMEGKPSRKADQSPAFWAFFPSCYERAFIFRRTDFPGRF